MTSNEKDRDFGMGYPRSHRRGCYRVRDLLHEKNAVKHRSALDPVRIFSTRQTPRADPRAPSTTSSRVSRGSAAGEDVELDIMGYLILMRVARRLKRTDSINNPDDPDPVV